MNSTKKSRRPDINCETLFVSLLAAGRELVHRKGPLFPGGFDAGATTYYCAREKTMMHPQDFELDRCESPAQLRKALARLWREAGDDELVALAEPLSRLAKKLRKSDEQSADVSSTMYVMF